MLDIHDYNGQPAIAAAGLVEEFRGIVLERRQATRILDQDAALLHDELDHGTGGRPEVMRAELRRTQLEPFPQECVPWGQKAVGARAVEDGEYEVRFGNAGGSVRSRLLVGADGAWSRVRPLLTAVPAYTGTSFVETYPWTTWHAGRG